MPDREDELIARLDAMGSRAGVGAPPMPAAVVSAVGARGGAATVVVRQSVPRVALAAAAVVVAAGVALVVMRGPVVERGGIGGAGPMAGYSGPATLLAMTERFNRSGSVDAALNVQGGMVGAGGVHEAAVPVYRAMDARTGLLPE